MNSMRRLKGLSLKKLLWRVVRELKHENFVLIKFARVKLPLLGYKADDSRANVKFLLESSYGGNLTVTNSLDTKLSLNVNTAIIEPITIHRYHRGVKRKNALSSGMTFQPLFRSS